MRDRVLGFGWPFAPSESSNSTRKPRLFDWTDDPGAATVDIVVYIGMVIADGIDQPGRKLAWIHESPEIARWQGTAPYIESNLEKVMASYEWVLASDRAFCELHERIVYHPAAANLPWIPERQYAIYKKDKLCSMFASMKDMVPAHRYRREVAARLKDKLDLFGGACGSPRIGGNATHPDKSQGMIPYMFQVVMENANADFYYTEKIADCFATGTVPIYWGSRSIGEIFDTNGIIWFDDDFDVDSLSEELYFEMMPAIRNNFQRIQNLEGTDDLLYRKFIRGPVAGEEITPWIVPPRQRGTIVAPLRLRPPAAPAPGSVPWPPWDAGRASASRRKSDTGRRDWLEIVRAPDKRTVSNLAEVPPDRVTVRTVTSRMVPPGSVAAPMSWPPQLTEAFLLHLPDAFIGDNVVFDRTHFYSLSRWWLGYHSYYAAKIHEVRHLDAAVSVAAWCGEAFQHFVIDALPALASVIDLLETPELSDVKILSHTGTGSAADWFWQRLGLADRVVAKPKNVDAGFVVHADLVLAAHFEPSLAQLGVYPRHTLRPIQQRLGTLEPGHRDLAVYLQRRGLREVTNEEEMLARARRELAESDLQLEIFPGTDDPGGAIPLMRRARIVFGPHGGSFANILFAQPGTDVIEFVPIRRLLQAKAEDPLTMYYGLAQAAGLNYWFLEPDHFDLEKPGMIVDVDELGQTLRRALESSQ
jgi:hypothetical protein